MIVNAYTIYDVKSLQYHTPFFAVADGAAVRTFTDLVNDQNTMVGRHPADYRLYRIGAYDDSSGVLHPSSVLEHIVDAASLVQKQPDIFSYAHERGLRENGAGLNGSPERPVQE